MDDDSDGFTNRLWAGSRNKGVPIKGWRGAVDNYSDFREILLHGAMEKREPP